MGERWAALGLAAGLAACGGASGGGADGAAAAVIDAVAPVADALPRPDLAVPSPDMAIAPPDAATDPAPDAATVAPDLAPMPDAAAACPPCPSGTATGPAPECRCVDPSPWPVAGGVALDDTLCISAPIPGPGDRRDLFFQVLHSLGVKTIRHDLRWRAVEPVRGAFDFSGADTDVAAAEAEGIDVLAMLGYGNPWATSAPEASTGQPGGDEFYPPDDPADFGRFAGALAAHFGDRIRRYEIWNEQNAGYRFWKRPGQISGDPVAYGALLRAAHDAIRAASPAAQVAYGGLFYVPQAIIGAEDFLRQSLAADPRLGDAFEALAYHPYAPYPPRVPPEARAPDARPPYYAVDETADRLRALTTDLVGAAKPLWVTEYGWPTLNLPAEDQARWLLRTQLLLWARGVELACIYTWTDGNPDVDRIAPWEYTFGLITWDPTPGDPNDGSAWAEKPAAGALRRMHTLLGGDHFGVDLGVRYGLPENVRALGMLDATGARHVVVWSVDAPVEIVLPWADDAAPHAVELLGGTDVAIAPPMRGLLPLTATPTPVVLLP